MSATPTIPFGAPMIGDEEKAAVMEVLSGPILVHGPRAAAFEAAFAAWTGAADAVSAASCTAGMHLIWFALGLGPGDEVIVPAQTHVATAHAVALTGARPVFVDCDPATGNIDIDAMAAAVTPRTRGVAVVHFLGLPVDMARVMEIARPRGLFVLEDCALAVGARLDGVHAGLTGDAGAFSFYPVKHMTTAEGGMVVVRDPALAARLRLLRGFGVDRTHGERKVPGVYDVTALGFNYRMSEVHAAIGIEQVKKLDGFLARRRENAAVLRAGLADVPGLATLADPGGRFVHAHYCAAAVLEPDLRPRRAEVLTALAARGVGASVYYPHPVPRLAHYRETFGYDPQAFPHAAAISDGSISLPVGPHLDRDHMTVVAGAVRRVLREMRTTR